MRVVMKISPVYITTADETHSHRNVQQGHCQQKTVVAMRQARQQNAHGYHQCQKNKKPGPEKLPPPGLCKGVDPGYIFSAAFGKQISGLDNSDDDTGGQDHTGQKISRREAAGLHSQACPLDQQYKTAAIPEKGGQNDEAAHRCMGHGSS